MQETYSISELGREFGITTRAIRFYEDKQLLSPSRNGSHRVYSRADRTRLKLLLRGKRLGWPLEEIRRAQLQQQQKDIDAALTDLEQIQQRCNEHLATLNSQLSHKDHQPELSLSRNII